jgi:predicted RNA-binding Zn ribbon-like protein
MIRDEDLLLAVLNSAPVVDGLITEQLDGAAGRELAERFGGTGSAEELAHLRRTRDAVQDIVRGKTAAAGQLAAAVGDMALVPDFTDGGIHWDLEAPADGRLAARTVMAWSQVLHDLPGRLRACANTECNLFLVDHSRPGTAKWCSMATCGNRMKARAHSQRAKGRG